MTVIYVLIDPRTSMPFYVGATKRELWVRLNNHIRDVEHMERPMSEPHFYNKCKQIREILNQSLRPLIKAIFICENSKSYYCEYLAYTILIQSNHVLHQDERRFFIT